MGPAVKIVLATVAYALVHSVLASRAAKRLAARVFGETNARAFYRPFFVVQALATTGGLVIYVRRVPGGTIYHLRGPLAWLLHAGQAAALLHAYAAAREVGILRLSGLDGLRMRLHGRAVPQAPAAQGPEIDVQTGALRSGGPFRWSRHPLNLSGVPVFWLTPKLSTNRLLFNVLGTAYLILGSRHEEARLREAYGPQYSAYRQSGVPFFFPAVGRMLRRPD